MTSRNVLTRNRVYAAMCAFVLAIIVLTAFTLSIDQTRAELFPKNVRGYVEDLLGQGLEGANVTVNMKVGTTSTIRSTLWVDSTDPDGFYQVTFNGPYWFVGDTIEVIATYDSEFGTNSAIADSGPIQIVDVTIGIEIPEFSAFLGSPLTFVSIGLVAIVILSFRARKRNPLAPG